MIRIYLVLGISITLILAIGIYQHANPKVQESITYFPIDPNATFKTAETTLAMTDQQSHTILWKEHSTLDRKAYLRQDAALLYANGRLLDEMWKWKQNTAEIEQEKRMKIDNSSLLQAITFHHAELHDKEDQISSSHAMSSDQIYFITPAADEEKIKKQLDQQTERMLQLSWNKALRHFVINLKNYQAYPLSQFNELAKNVLPGFTKSQTDAIVGNLWEGLYKNYILGIKKADGTSENPRGSTLPLILIATDKTHILVLIETASGEPIVLRQMMGAVD